MTITLLVFLSTDVMEVRSMFDRLKIKLHEPACDIFYYLATMLHAFWKTGTLPPRYIIYDHSFQIIYAYSYYHYTCRFHFYTYHSIRSLEIARNIGSSDALRERKLTKEQLAIESYPVTPGKTLVVEALAG